MILENIVWVNQVGILCHFGLYNNIHIITWFSKYRWCRLLHFCSQYTSLMLATNLSLFHTTSCLIPPIKMSFIHLVEQFYLWAEKILSSSTIDKCSCIYLSRLFGGQTKNYSDFIILQSLLFLAHTWFWMPFLYWYIFWPCDFDIPGFHP